MVYDDGQERFQLKIVKKDEKIEKIRREQPLEVNDLSLFFTPKFAFHIKLALF